MLEGIKHVIFTQEELLNILRDREDDGMFRDIKEFMAICSEERVQTSVVAPTTDVWQILKEDGLLRGQYSEKLTSCCLDRLSSKAVVHIISAREEVLSPKEIMVVTSDFDFVADYNYKGFVVVLYHDVVKYIQESRSAKECHDIEIQVFKEAGKYYATERLHIPEYISEIYDIVEYVRENFVTYKGMHVYLPLSEDFIHSGCPCIIPARDRY